MKKETLLEVSILVCMICLLALGTAIYHVNRVSGDRDRQFDKSSQEAIVLNCQEIENVKESLRNVFKRLVAFNVENEIPAADERTKLYADFIHDYFAPNSCPRKGGIQ